MKIKICPFDKKPCSGGFCFEKCPHCGLLRPLCSRFDVVMFNSKGFPRGDFK